jgi:hypothetical protein
MTDVSWFEWEDFDFKSLSHLPPKRLLFHGPIISSLPVMGLHPNKPGEPNDGLGQISGCGIPLAIGAFD